MKRLYVSGLAFLTVVAACSDVAEEETLDAAPLYGCYFATGSPMLIVTATGVRIASVEAPTPYRYEMRKIGPVLNLPLVAEVIDGNRTFQRSENNEYRVFFVQGQPVIRVAFGKEGNVSDYVRYSGDDCKT